MNLNKSRDVFDPSTVKDPVHIIGCGSVGSTVAELLARYGITKFVLWDMDLVESKNIVNQMFTERDVGRLKTEALLDILSEINPAIKDTARIESNGWSGQPLTGYIFLAVDNIEIRKEIVNKNKYNAMIKAMFDVRTSLFDAQLYAADWKSADQKKNFIATMDFTHEEATAEVPKSACGEVLGVAPTVRAAATFTVTNFQLFVVEHKIKNTILVAPFNLNGEGAVLAM